jgi:hypothetical protein
MLHRVEERSRGSIAVTNNMNDQRWTSASWANIPGRAVTHTKLFNNDNTVIRVTYMDTLGFAGSCHGISCRWRLLVDGNNLAGTREFWSHSSPGTGWRIYPMKLVWYPTVSPGAHTYTVQVRRLACNPHLILSLDF